MTDTIIIRDSRIGLTYLTGNLEMTEADVDAARAAVDEVLPAYCHWQPATSEIIGPVETPAASDDEFREHLLGRVLEALDISA